MLDVATICGHDYLYGVCDACGRPQLVRATIPLPGMVVWSCLVCLLSCPPWCLCSAPTLAWLAGCFDRAGVELRAGVALDALLDRSLVGPEWAALRAALGGVTV